MSEKVGSLLIELGMNVARLQQDASQSARIIKQTSDQMTSALNTVKSAAGALGIGLSGAAISAFIRSTANAADELGKMSQKVGVSVESLSALEYAGKLANVSNESLAIGLRQLSKNIDEGSDTFTRLGISLTDHNGKAKTTEQVLGEVADRFSGMQDGAGKTSIALSLLGKSGSDLIPLLNDGAQGLARMRSEASRMGVLVSAETAKAAEQFNDNLTRLDASLQGLGMTLANPVIAQLGEFTSLLLKTKDLTGSMGGGLLAAFGIGALDGGNVNEKISALTEKLGRLRTLRDDLTKPTLANKINNALPWSDLGDVEKQIAVGEKELALLRQLQAEKMSYYDLGAKPKTAAPPRLSAAGAAPGNDPLFDMKAFFDNQWNKQVDETLRLTADAKREWADAWEKQDQAVVQSFDALYGQSQVGKVKGLEAELGNMNQLLTDGRITTDEYTAAYGVWEQRFNEAMGRASKETETFTSKSKNDMQDLINAVHGWGNEFTDTLTDAFMGAGWSFTKLADSIIRDMIRMQIQKGITDPLISAGGAALGSLFGGGATTNIPAMASGTNYVPKDMLAMIHQGEAVVPKEYNDGGMKGVSVKIVNYIDSRSDTQTIMAATNMAVARAESNIMNSMQRNGRFAKATR